MANSLSAKKRIRQNAKRRAQNRARKFEIKEAVKGFSTALTGGDGAKASESLRGAVKTIDRMAAKGAIHRNAASRKKSRLQRKLNALGKAAG